MCGWAANLLVPVINGLVAAGIGLRGGAGGDRSEVERLRLLRLDLGLLDYRQRVKCQLLLGDDLPALLRWARRCLLEG